MSTKKNEINPYITGLNGNNAYWMARLSKEVYSKKDGRSEPDTDGILASLKKDDPKFLHVWGFDKNSAQAALIEHEEYFCIAFRGTDELLDWLDNLNGYPERQLFGEFHRGFWQSTEDVWEDLDASLTELQEKKRKPIFITGHSLGGAMATVAAAKFIHVDKPFTSVYTFGQPRVLKKKTAQIFNMECKSNFFRFHNNNDLVTRVPARLMGYSHIGTYLYISEEGRIHREIGFWNKFVDSAKGAYEDAKEKGLDGIKDHDINQYLAAIERWEVV